MLKILLKWKKHSQKSKNIKNQQIYKFKLKFNKFNKFNSFKKTIQQIKKGDFKILLRIRKKNNYYKKKRMD